jgi:hypothetical protein
MSACGGSQRSAEEARPQRAESSYYDEGSPRRDLDEPAGERSASESKASNEPTAEPQFTENMSVDDAIRAVPPGIERRNIDQETLAKPLQDVALYESCKAGSARIKLRVAVWDGKAVGIDVTSTPKNDKLSACIKAKIAEVTWEKKVKSLNTIEYQL